MKIINLGALFIVFVFLIGTAQADSINTSDFKKAQKAMAAGDYGKAFKEYRRIAKKDDNPLAHFSLGLFFENGWGRPVNRGSACKHFKEAAQGGIPFGAHLYAECLEDGVNGPADYEQAAVWYEKAAELGYNMSLCSLAELYMTGKGVPKNPQKAVELCQQSAQQASVPAQVRVGRFYLEGDESIRNYQAAAKWFEYAAERNNPEAQYYLGVIVRDGHAGPMKPGADRYHFELAAAQGYVPAYFQTGKLYFNAPVDPETGMIPKNDLAKAYMWLSAAVKRTEDKEESTEAAEMLKKISEVMPKTWEPDLDHKVVHHLEEYHLN